MAGRGWPPGKGLAMTRKCPAPVATVVVGAGLRCWSRPRPSSHPELSRARTVCQAPRPIWSGLDFRPISRHPPGPYPRAELLGGMDQLVPHLRNSRIYIADDQPANVALLEAILGRAGYTAISTFSNGASLLWAIRAQEPEIVLLDLHMPVMDGMG